MTHNVVRDQSRGTMRQSRYNEIIPIDDRKYFLFNTVTCAADIVDENVVGWLRNLRLDYHETERGFSQVFIQRMVSQGYITESSAADEEKLIRKKFEELRPRFLRRKQHGLVLTYDCNMRCTYCFEQDLQSRDQPSKTFPVITKEMLGKIFEIITSQDARNNPERRYPITLFGGEPLMVRNYDLVEEIVVRAAGLGYPISIITNGYDLLHFIPLLKRFPGKIDLHVTLDGPPEIHDRQRPALNGEPTFDQISKGLEAALAEKMPVYIRCNVDSHTVNQLPQFAKLVQEKGWDQNPLVHFTLANIGIADDYGCVNRAQHKSDQQPILPKKLPWQQQLGRASAFEKMVLSRVLQGKKPIRFPRFWFCDAHTGLQLYDPFGNIYACHEMVGRENALIGRYWPALEIDEISLGQWQQRDVFSMKSCSHCKYSLLCGGGCACQAISRENDMTQSVCWDIKGFLQEYISMYFKESPDAARLLLMASTNQ